MCKEELKDYNFNSNLDLQFKRALSEKMDFYVSLSLFSSGSFKSKF